MYGDRAVNVWDLLPYHIQKINIMPSYLRSSTLISNILLIECCYNKHCSEGIAMDKCTRVSAVTRVSGVTRVSAVTRVCTVTRVNMNSQVNIYTWIVICAP